MAYEIDRVMRAFASQPWFIDPRKAEQIVAMLQLRSQQGHRPAPYRSDGGADDSQVSERSGRIAVIRLYGTIAPRAEALKDVSQSAALMTKFQAAFKEAATDTGISAIVLDIDSPGGRVDLVPETAAMIRNARRADRPIVAIANTLAASAAYWIASAADELVVTPSGEVGSIGVYMLHQDVSERLAAEGVRMTFISEGSRKVEGNPFEPLSGEALSALQANAKYMYDMFVADVAAGRGVSADIVRADPENSDRHFGGGRIYPAQIAVRLGMADRVATFDETISRLSQKSGQAGSSVSAKRRRLALHR